MIPGNFPKKSQGDSNKKKNRSLDEGIPMGNPPKNRKIEGTVSRPVDQELPPEPKPSIGALATPQRIPPKPPVPTMKQSYNHQYPLPPPPINNQKPVAELPTKTMMLPPTPANPIPPPTQMLPVTPIPSKAQLQPPRPPPPPQGIQYIPRPPAPSTQQPLPPPPPPPPLPPSQPRQNATVMMAVAPPLPAITAPSPLAPVAPTPIVEAKKQNENVTVDVQEGSDKKKKDVINDWIRTVLSHGIEGLKKEYQDSPNGGSLESAKTFSKNPTRNRYINIPCCEATRVKLAEDPHFYIHANVVSSGPFPKRFICAQAPLNGTIEDFWKMIIFSGLEYIVMLCELVEGGKPKSAEYFPAKIGGTLKIGKLCTVTKVSTEVIDKILTLSTLRVAKKDNSEVTWTVKHIHWHKWPDHGVPDNFLSPFRLFTLIKSCSKPIVVHCSAGVGRTGTLVLILIIIESLRLPDFQGVPRLLAKLREERFKSIQTEMQYIYVHRCILEYLILKKFTYSADDYAKFKKEYKALEKSSENKN